MTDRLECPDCAGAGQQTLGPLTVRCVFCRGYGYVGDDNEPAERNDDTTTDLHPMSATPVWDNIGAASALGCTRCLGTGRVVGLGGDVRGGIPAKLVGAPCPACSKDQPAE